MFIILKFETYIAVSSLKMDEKEISAADPSKTSSAISFSVDFDQPKKAKRKPPKHLLERHNKRKEVSQESIEEKQRRAEDRRKVCWSSITNSYLMNVLFLCLETY